MPDPTYIVRAEFIAETWESLSTRTWTALSAETWENLAFPSLADLDVLRINIVRQRANVFAKLEPGRASLILDNFGGRYSPDNAASPYTGRLTPNKAVAIRAQTDAGSLYDLFTGVVDRFVAEPALERRTVHVMCSDRTKELLRRRVDLPVAVTVNAGSLYTQIASAAGIVASNRAIDALNDTIPFAWFRNTVATAAIDEVTRLGFYQAFVGPNGVLRVKGRYFGLDGSVVASYSNDFLAFGYALADDRVINFATVQGEPRKASTSANTVAWLEEKPQIAAGASVGFTLAFVDPVTRERETPATSVSIVSASDYTTNTKSDGTGTDQTSATTVTLGIFGASAVCTVTNASSDAVFLTKFQLGGFSLRREPHILRTSTDNSSQLVHGEREYTLASDLIGGLLYAQDYADFLVRQHKTPRPDVSYALKNQFPDVLARDLGDIVALVESNTAVGSRFTITELEHDITLERGLEHTTRYTTELWDVGPWLILDHATLGKLDSGRQLAF